MKQTIDLQQSNLADRGLQKGGTVEVIRLPLEPSLLEKFEMVIGAPVVRDQGLPRSCYSAPILKLSPVQ